MISYSQEKKVLCVVLSTACSGIESEVRPAQGRGILLRLYDYPHFGYWKYSMELKHLDYTYGCDLGQMT